MAQCDDSDTRALPARAVGESPYTTAKKAHVTQQYVIHTSDASNEPAWDAFLAATPGGHHVQTSLWAQVKAVVGMNAVRVLATMDGKIIGGGQILIQRLPLLGSVGYVQRGPVVSIDDASLRESLINSIKDVARELGVRHLTIQPPPNGLDLESTLVQSGFQRTDQAVSPSASTIVDLQPALDAIMARMHKKTRYNIRLGARRGMTVRQGEEADFAVYHKMAESTALRQGFRPYPMEYYATMWRVLSPHGYLRFTVVENEGEVVAAQFAVPFGDTIVNKLPVWSGQRGGDHPNEVLHWDVIEWGKDHGFRFYDLEGIDMTAAHAILNGEPLPPDLEHSVTKFKLGFGGDVRIFPGTYFFASNALLKWTYGSALPRVSDWSVVKKAMATLRTKETHDSEAAHGGRNR